MSNRIQTISVPVLLAVLVLIFAGGRAQRGQAENAPILSSTDAPYSVPGPYAVGMQSLTTGGAESLAITLWYPVLAGEPSQETVTYPYQIKVAKPLGTVSVATYAGQARPDAPANRSAGPYPGVILSPGFSIGAATYGWLAEHIASYGFVVIAPEHPESMDAELSGLWQSVPTRPQDILAVLAYVDAQTAADGVFDGLIDAEQMAVVGHSYGGYTALAAAGARMDTESFTAHCANVYATEHPSAWLCDKLVPHLPEMAAGAGLDAVPDGLWPAWADPRVDAIVSLAGDAYFFGQEGLAQIDIPVLAVGGTQDQDTPYLWGTQPTYEYVSSPAKVRVGLEGAEHMIFTGPCEKIPFYLRLISNEFCADPGWDRQYAHELVRHLATAFLLAELKGDVQAAAALAPAAVAFPSVDYTAQGY